MLRLLAPGPQGRCPASHEFPQRRAFGLYLVGIVVPPPLNRPSDATAAPLEALVYERLLPTHPDSITRVRTELGTALVHVGVNAARRADVALTVSEAASNVVLHAYPPPSTGPLYVAATLRENTLVVSVVDCGCGIRPRTDSPGAGLGLGIIAAVATELRVTSWRDDIGTTLQATFGDATEGPRSPAQTAPDAHADLFREYLSLLRARHMSLQQDTQAVLAQARLAVRRGERLRRHTPAD